MKNKMGIKKGQNVEVKGAYDHWYGYIDFTGKVVGVGAAHYTVIIDTGCVYEGLKQRVYESDIVRVY